MKCSKCNTEMKDLFMSQYCPNDCDKKQNYSDANVVEIEIWQNFAEDFDSQIKYDTWYHYSWIVDHVNIPVNSKIEYAVECESNLIALWRFEDEVD